VTQRLPFDVKSLSTAVVLALVAAAANAIWIFLDHASPSWDQAHYLTVTLDYRFGFASEGIGGLLHALGNADTSHGPLFTVAMLPFFYAFGSTPRSGLILNFALAPVLYVAVGQIAWIVFRNWIARLLAILLVASMPLMVGLYHDVLQDFLLVTLTAVSILLLLLTRQFDNRRASLMLGLAMGLGTLTKVTFPIFLAGPLLVVFAQTILPMLKAGSRRATHPGRILGNVFGAVAVCLAVALPWYLPNLTATLEYIRSTTSGPLSEGAGPTDPLTFHAIVSFTMGVFNENVSWIIGLTGLIAIGLCLSRLPAWRSMPTRLLVNLGFLLAWALIPYLLIATAHNQDVRLMAPAMPAIAVIVGGAMSAVRRSWIRITLIATTVAALSYQSINHVTNITPRFFPGDVHVRIASYVATIPLDDRPIGYERLPEPDYATPVVRYIEELVDREAGPPAPRSVCVLESEQVVNTNTFSYLAKARNDQLEFADLLVGEEGIPGLRTALLGCDFALYVRQPPSSKERSESRIVIVNEDFAAGYMTPSLLALFPGPSQRFRVAAPSGEERKGAQYLSTADRGSYVQVLSLHPDVASCRRVHGNPGAGCSPGSRRG
jgi:4-amino-4-deoxy-L-arabinose transferase-like glycosyltransferase